MNGDSSEAVFKASLKALGLSAAEIEHELDMACLDWVENAKKDNPEDARHKKSLDWINDYLKR